MRKIDKLSPMRLKVIEFQRYLSGGVTRPLLVVAVDEYGQMHTIVLKLRHPDSETGHFEETSLACELVCSVIARSLDLPVPDYAIVEVPRAFPQNVEAESARKLLQRNIGSNFGTVYHEGLMKWVEEDSRNASDALMERFEHVISFDAAVINKDRTRQNSNLLVRGDSSLLLIDHSVALPAHNWPDAQIGASPLFGDTDIQRHCGSPLLKGKRREYSHIFNLWLDKITADELRQIRAFIPSSWERKRGDLDRIFRFLKGRPRKFGEQSDCLKGNLS